MYSNISRKIKILAQVWGLLTLIGGELAFLIILFDDGFEDSWYFLIIGLVGLASSWPLYGFGELIEKVQKIADSKSGTSGQSQALMSATLNSVSSFEEGRAVREREYVAGEGWTCPNCGKKHYPYETSCSCGASRFDAKKK